MTKPMPAALVALVTLAGGPAHADDRAACVDAASKGQTLRDAHKLVEAREQFRACSQQGCPAVVQRDCVAWLDGIERSIATIVVTAKDERGASADARVTMDGQPFATQLDGQSVAVNPGKHVFRFEWSEGSPVDLVVVVREGEKNQPVSAALARGSAAPPGVSGPSETPRPASEGSASAWKTVGFVLGGIGVVGVGVGAAFGIAAIVDTNDAACNGHVCTAGPLDRARTASTWANVGLIGGGVALAAGGALVLFLPGARPASVGNDLRVTPLLGAGCAGLSLGGRFEW